MWIDNEKYLLQSLESTEITFRTICRVPQKPATCLYWSDLEGSHQIRGKESTRPDLCSSQGKKTFSYPFGALFWSLIVAAESHLKLSNSFA
ncbi:hypothetical protein HNY73_011856 [Argiope bruennichi]|uniref:Uncharacterized protein n=1 Tax=Argiope bruennichi TaxID=94029 RepID=A0A8T0ET45_ARGBR|nr:hypothetical protein HNY73_011856 [Argiope bruennichi]